jgi:hypothetical protein
LAHVGHPVTFRFVLSVMLVPLVVVIPFSVPAAASATSETDTPHDLQTRVRAELRAFTDWLETNGARGYIGEVGWPNDFHGEAAQWNRLADAWYADADAARLWVAYWDSGESRNTYPLAAYKPAVWMRPAVSIVDTQAEVIEAHRSTVDYQRGIYLATGVRGAPYQDETASAFSNANPGVFGADYKYDETSTHAFLASRGLSFVTIGFRWERLQPALGAEFEPTEIERLRAAVSSARSAGLQVILQPFNKGAYYKFDGSRGVKRMIGSPTCTQAHFNDLWVRLSNEFKDDSTVIAYGLMNEPAESISPRNWEIVSQAALDAIRANGDAKLIMLPGARWSALRDWLATHPTAWINDPAQNFRYEAHHYFDSDGSGVYASRYAEESASSNVSSDASRARQVTLPRPTLLGLGAIEPAT